MPRGRSTSSKRHKEQARKQRQQDKAERRYQRKHETPTGEDVDEMAELQKDAAAQAALFNLGAEDADRDDRSNSDNEIAIE